jgi:dTDP-4-dehydrorhamnose reductase
MTPERSGRLGREDTVVVAAAATVVTLAAVTAEAAADTAAKSPGGDARLGQRSGMTPERISTLSRGGS